MIALSEEKAEM